MLNNISSQSCAITLQQFFKHIVVIICQREHASLVETTPGYCLSGCIIHPCFGGYPVAIMNMQGW